MFPEIGAGGVCGLDKMVKFRPTMYWWNRLTPKILPNLLYPVENTSSLLVQAIERRRQQIIPSHQRACVRELLPRQRVIRHRPVGEVWRGSSVLTQNQRSEFPSHGRTCPAIQNPKSKWIACGVTCVVEQGVWIN